MLSIFIIPWILNWLCSDHFSAAVLIWMWRTTGERLRTRWPRRLAMRTLLKDLLPRSGSHNYRRWSGREAQQNESYGRRQGMTSFAYQNISAVTSEYLYFWVKLASVQPLTQLWYQWWLAVCTFLKRYDCIWTFLKRYDCLFGHS